MTVLTKLAIKLRTEAEVPDWEERMFRNVCRLATYLKYGCTGQLVEPLAMAAYLEKIMEVDVE